jgi:hypothetical protein
MEAKLILRNLDKHKYNYIVTTRNTTIGIFFVYETSDRSKSKHECQPLTGMQVILIGGAESRAMPHGKLLPQYLKDLGYKMCMAGK